MRILPEVEHEFWKRTSSNSVSELWRAMATSGVRGTEEVDQAHEITGVSHEDLWSMLGYRHDRLWR